MEQVCPFVSCLRLGFQFLLESLPISYHSQSSLTSQWYYRFVGVKWFLNEVYFLKFYLNTFRDKSRWLSTFPFLKLTSCLHFVLCSVLWLKPVTDYLSWRKIRSEETVTLKRFNNNPNKYSFNILAVVFLNNYSFNDFEFPRVLYYITVIITTGFMSFWEVHSQMKIL